MLLSCTPNACKLQLEQNIAFLGCSKSMHPSSECKGPGAREHSVMALWSYPTSSAMPVVPRLASTVGMMRSLMSGGGSSLSCTIVVNASIMAICTSRAERSYCAACQALCTSKTAMLCSCLLVPCATCVAAFTAAHDTSGPTFNKRSKLEANVESNDATEM